MTSNSKILGTQSYLSNAGSNASPSDLQPGRWARESPKVDRVTFVRYRAYKVWAGVEADCSQIESKGGGNALSEIDLVMEIFTAR